MLMRWAYDVRDVTVAERLQRDAFKLAGGRTGGK
jgi:hypothetical protein